MLRRLRSLFVLSCMEAEKREIELEIVVKSFVLLSISFFPKLIKQATVTTSPTSLERNSTQFIKSRKDEKFAAGKREWIPLRKSLINEFWSFFSRFSMFSNVFYRRKTYTRSSLALKLSPKKTSIRVRFETFETFTGALKSISQHFVSYSSCLTCSPLSDY